MKNLFNICPPCGFSLINLLAVGTCAVWVVFFPTTPWLLIPLGLSLLVIVWQGHWIRTICENEKRKNAILDLHASLICRAQPDTTLTYVNAAYCQYFGKSKKELLGQRFIGFLPPEEQDRLYQHLEEIKRTRSSVIYENFLIGSEGKRWFRWVSHPIYDSKGQLTEIQGIGTDITEEKEAKARLEESEANMRDAIEIAKLGTWRYDLTNDQMHWDERQREIFGLSPEDSSPRSFEEFMEYVQPENQADFFEEYHCIRTSTMPSAQMSKERTFKIKCKNDHQVKHLMGRQRVIIKKGKPLGLQGINLDISHLKKVEEELTEQKHFLESIIQALPGNVFLFNFHDFTLSYLNGKGTKGLFYSLEELENMGREGYLALIHPKDLQSFRDYEESLRHHPSKINEITYRIKNKEGEYRWIQNFVRLYPRSPGQKAKEIIGFNLDVTKQKRLSEELLQKKQLLESLFDHLPIGLQIFDRDGFSLKMNKAQAHLLGVSSTEYGVGQYNVLTDPYPVATKKNLDYHKAYRGETVFLKRVPVQLSDPHNQWHTRQDKLVLNTTIYPIPNQEGEVEMVVAVHQDVSDEYYQQQELKAKNKALLKARKEAEEALRVKDEFLADMSHEIRNPLNNIVGLTHILSEEELPRHLEAYLEALNVSSHHLLELLNRILDYAKIKSGEIKIKPEAFLVQELCRQVLNSFQKSAHQKGIALSLELEPSLKVQAFQSDQMMLYQVLSNLMSNAIKFTSSGTVRLAVLLVSENETTTSLRFEVSDTGQGIPEEKLTYIFERFAQVRAVNLAKPEGTGLGLAICNELLRLLDSRLEVKSVYGKGSTFAFTLHLKKVSNLSKNKPQLQIPRPSELRTILIVEDNQINRQVLQKLLQDWGYQVLLAQHGKEGLEQLQANPVDLVLIDLQMPELDGLQTIRRIKAQPSIWLIPIIVMTAHVHPQEEEALRKLGIQLLLQKPLSPKVLQKKLHEILFSSQKSSSYPSEKQSIIEMLAQGDEKFSKRMKKMFLNETHDFLRDYEIYLKTKDLQNLKRLIHNYKTSLAIFEIEEPKPLIEEGKKLLEQEANLEAIEHHIHLLKASLLKMLETFRDMEEN